MSTPPKSPLEQEVDELRAKLRDLEVRVRLDAVAEMFIAGDHSVRLGDYFLADGDYPTKLYSVSSDGKWTYESNGRTIEPFRIPTPTEHPRLYTIAEVAEIVAKLSKPR